MNRIKFIKNSLKSFGGLALLPTLLHSRTYVESTSIGIDKVKEFVSAGHNDIDKVKEMISERPNLIYAKYDWGNGDFEEAIEGAGHVGNKEIANFLIEQGARVNLFTLTMIGRTDLVIPVVEEFPNLLFAKGPHGFSLLHHANVGGKDANKLKEYFLEKGLKEEKFNI